MLAEVHGDGVRNLAYLRYGSGHERSKMLQHFRMIRSYLGLEFLDSDAHDSEL